MQTFKDNSLKNIERNLSTVVVSDKSDLVNFQEYLLVLKS